ncbi:MAG: cupin domain-containing protein, partial [Antricoccus sp.]
VLYAKEVSVQLIPNGNAPSHYMKSLDSPSVTVLFREDDDADIGMVRVDIPPGAGMPQHRHNGSDVILTPVAGAVRVIKEGAATDVQVGDVLLILKDEIVELTNPHDDPAEITVTTTLPHLSWSPVPSTPVQSDL